MRRQIAETLHRWLQEEPVLTATESLALVRALAPLVEHEVVRNHLKRLLALPDTKGPPNGTVASSNPPSARERTLTNTLELASRTAALALARSNRLDAISELGQWLRRPSPEAEYAAQALMLAPPTDITPLLEASGPVTPLLLRTLARLRRLEALPFLRQTLQRATAPVQAAAAQALVELGVDQTLELALHWLAQPKLAPELLHVSTHILFHHQHDARKRAFTLLIQADPLLALDIAARHTDPTLLLLGDHLAALPDITSRKRALAHVARVGEASVPLLSKTLTTNPELAVTATALLARMSSTEAAAVLRDDNSTLGVLGLTVSALRGNVDRADVRASFEAQLRKRTGAEPYALQLGLAALDVNFAQKLLTNNEPRDLHMAAAVAGVHDASYRTQVARRLAEFSEQPLDPKALALSSALSAMSLDVSLPSTLLEVWADSSLPVAYPAVWQLCTRLPMTPHGPVTRWLASDDPELRAAAYQGLGSNPDPKHTAQLLAALSTEVDPWARRSLTAALAKRPTISPVHQALQREKNYNPDAFVQRLWGESTQTTPSDVRIGDYWLDARPKTRISRSFWLTLTSPTHPPVSVPLLEATPLLFFLSDARPLDVEGFRAKTQRVDFPPK